MLLIWFNEDDGDIPAPIYSNRYSGNSLVSCKHIETSQTKRVCISKLVLRPNPNTACKYIGFRLQFALLQIGFAFFIGYSFGLYIGAPLLFSYVDTYGCLAVCYTVGGYLLPAGIIVIQMRQMAYWFYMCNDHCLCSESLGVRRQVRWGGCGTGTVSRISGKAMDKFRCTWVAMIGEIYELIVEYLENGFRQEFTSYIENELSNQGSFYMICTIVAIIVITAIVIIFAICSTIVFPDVLSLAEGLLALILISRYKS